MKQYPSISMLAGDTDGLANDAAGEALTSEFGFGVHGEQVRNGELLRSGVRLVRPEPNSPAGQNPMSRPLNYQDYELPRAESRQCPPSVQPIVNQHLS
jgi:hypothetical protein